MKCPPHSPVEVHLAVLALAALAKGQLARVLAVQMAAVSHAAMDVATVVAVAVTVVTALRLEVAACSVGLVRVRVPVRTAVDHVGRMLTVDQIRAARMMVDQVGAPVAALLAAVGRAGLVFVVVVQRDLVPHDQVRHDQVRRDQVRQGLGTRGGPPEAMVEVLQEMIEKRVAASHIVEITRVPQHVVTGEVTTIDGGTTDMEATVATMIDVAMTADPVLVTSGALMTAAEEADIEGVATVAVEVLVVHSVLNGRSEHGRTTVRHVKSARLVNRATRLSAVQRRFAPAVAGQLGSGSFQPNGKSTLING